MEQWLDNPWFIGIGASVLSGFFVSTVSRFLLSRRENREYNQKIVTVNKEVVHSIRPGVAEGHVPSESVLNSLIAATARRYGVAESDAYTPAEIGQELVKEVMDSSFIPAKTKDDFCSKIEGSLLLSLGQTPTATERVISIEKAQMKGESSSAVSSEYRLRIIRNWSILLGAISALATIATAVWYANEKTAIELGQRLLIIPAALLVILMLATMFLQSLERAIERLRRVHREWRRYRREAKRGEAVDEGAT